MKNWQAQLKMMQSSGAPKWWLAGGVAAEDCVAAYQAKGAVSLAASYINLANPGTHDAALGVAPTLGADGWVFDGLTQYLTTGIIPVHDTYSLFVRVASIESNGVCCGVVSNLRFTIYPNEGGTTYWRCFGGCSETFANGQVYGITRAFGWRDGVARAAIAPDPPATAFKDIKIGGFTYQNEDPVYTWTGIITCLSIYKVELLSDVVVPLTEAMQAL